MNKFLIALLAGLFFVTGYAQRNDEVSGNDINEAKSYKSQFDDEDLLNTAKKVDISFSLNKRSGMVEVIEKTSVNLLNLNTSFRTQYPVFYDAESSVGDFEIKNQNGKKRKGVNYLVKDEYLKQADLFHTDYRVKFVNLNFPLQGYRHIVETEKIYRDIKYFTSYYFTDAYRIVEGSLNITIPEWLDLDIKEFNLESYNITKAQTKTEDGTTQTYTFKRVAPRSQESGTPGPSYMYPHILFIAKSFNNGDTTKNLFSSTDDLYTWYNSLVEQVAVDASVFSEKVKELTEGKTSDKEKIESIYYWVQDNIRYIAFEDGIAGFQPDSPQNVYTKRYGDCKGMAFLTKAMLEEAGFDSRLVWIGTDRLAYDYSIPSLSVDNHMICAVNLNNETIFLDGTEKYNRFGEYATRIQNKQAMIQGNGSYSIETVPLENDTTNKDETSLTLKIEGETLSGTATRAYYSENRVQFQNVYNSFEKGDQIDILSGYLSGGNSNYIVSEIVPFNPEIRADNIALAYNVEVKSAVSEFDGTLYVDLDPLETASKYTFDKRKSDYKFPFKQKSEVTISLKIPEGYALESVPKNYTVSTDLMDMEVQFKEQSGFIEYSKQLNFKERVISKKRFDEWNSLFEGLKETTDQQIILKKQ